MSPCFGILKYLNLSLGFTAISQFFYEEYSSFPIHANPIFIGRSSLSSVNLFWLVLLGPFLVGVVLKILSLSKKYEKKRLVHYGARYALGSFTLYGLFFLAYGEFGSLALNLRYFEAENSSFISIVIGFLFALLMGVYVLLSHRYPKWFGSFKDKFYRY